MSLDSVPSLKKRIVFFSSLALMVLGTSAMSFYKISVANAYLTLAVPEPAQKPPELGPEADLSARGAHVAGIVGCAGCHGPDLSGKTLIDRPGYASLSAPNLTGGAGGRAVALGAEGTRRALRTGLDGERRALWVMPRAALLALAETDVDALVHFVREQPAVDHTLAQNRLQGWGYIDVTLRRLRLIDRTTVPVVPRKNITSVGIGAMAVPLGAAPQERAQWRARPPQAQDADLGPYLRAIGGCADCHGQAQPRPTYVTAAPLPQKVLLADAPERWRACVAAPRLQAMTPWELAAVLGN